MQEISAPSAEVQIHLRNGVCSGVVAPVETVPTLRYLLFRPALLYVPETSNTYNMLQYCSEVANKPVTQV